MYVNSVAFELTEDNQEILCYGYFRSNLNVSVKGIADIALKYLKSLLSDYHISNHRYSNLKYMSNGSIICKFQALNRSIRHHFKSTIIMTPFISEIFNQSPNKYQYSMKVRSIKDKCHISTFSIYELF